MADRLSMPPVGDDNLSAIDVALSANTLYGVLQVRSDVSSTGLTRAYRRLALLIHPDKLQNAGEATVKKANEALQKVIEAYRILSDLCRRIAYDRMHDFGAPAPPPPPSHARQAHGKTTGGTTP